MKSRAVTELIAISLVAAACGLTDHQPIRTASPVALSLVTELAECGSLGGCAAYASINRVGAAAGPETRLSNLGGRRATQGLPGLLDPGTYVAHFRLVALSDDLVNGQPATETTMAICSEQVVAPGDHLWAEVDLVVVFRARSCLVTQTLKVVDA